MSLPFLTVLLLLVTARWAAAQPSPPSDPGYNRDPYSANFNAATAVLIVVIVSAFFFLAFFSVYFRRCSRDRSAVVPAGAVPTAASRRGGARRGLDPSVIETFPVLSYSSAAGLKIGKGELECAVCLSEFSGDETLRMLPRCCHVFHPDCIDTWLAGHVTCPVCRDNLSVGPAPDCEAPAIPGSEEESPDGTGRDNTTDHDANNHEVAIDLTRIGRSHSTGHVTGGGDRFTLRLPEHVRREIVAAGRMRRSASVAVFGAGGEGSSRRGYRGGSPRSVWAGLSDRWASGILLRVSTWRRGEVAGAAAVEGSVKKTETRGEGSLRGGGAVFSCLKPGGDDSTSTAVLGRV